MSATNTTKQEAINLVAKAIEAGKVLQVCAYSGEGTLTIGPAIKAVGPSCFAAYWYKRWQGDAREGYSLEVADWFVERVGRGAAGKAARAVL